MGFDFNKLKDSAKNLTEQTINKVSEINQDRIDAKEAEYESNKDNPDFIFKATNTIGSFQVDSVNKLFRFASAQTLKDSNKKNGITFGKVAAFAMTGGLSAVVEVSSNAVKKITRKPDSAYRFSELIDFELLEDNSQVMSGGLGRSLVGAVAFGGVGAIVGGVTANRKTKKVVESMYIKITVNDIDNPMLLIPMITRSTKTSSYEYQEIFSNAHKIMSTLNVIANNK